MIVFQARHVIFESIQTRRRQNTRLAHAAAGHLTPAIGALDVIRIADQQGTHRRTQPFGEANGERVAILRNFFQLAAVRHYGVKNARTVNVQAELALAGEVPRRFQVLAGQHFTVVGIFQTAQFCAGEMNIVGFDFCRDLIERECTVRRGVNRLRLDAAKHRRTAGFVEIVMRALADNILFAALAVAEQRHEVRLRAGRQEQRGLLATQLCRIAL